MSLALSSIAVLNEFILTKLILKNACTSYLAPSICCFTVHLVYPISPTLLFAPGRATVFLYVFVFQCQAQYPDHSSISAA